MPSLFAWLVASVIMSDASVFIKVLTSQVLQEKEQNMLERKMWVLCGILYFQGFNGKNFVPYSKCQVVLNLCL